MKDKKSVEKLNLIKKLSENSYYFNTRCELMYQNLTTILYRFNDGASLEDFIEVYYKDNQVLKNILDDILDDITNIINEIDNLTRQ